MNMSHLVAVLGVSGTGLSLIPCGVLALERLAGNMIMIIDLVEGHQTNIGSNVTIGCGIIWELLLMLNQILRYLKPCAMYGSTPTIGLSDLVVADLIGKKGINIWLK